MSNLKDYQPELCFKADLPGGTVDLILSGQPESEFNPVSATLELGKYEPLIQALEAWLDHGLDLTYGKSTFASGTLFSIVPKEPGLSAVKVSLAPATWVAQQNMFLNIDHSKYSIEWEHQQAFLALGEVTLTESDRLKLKEQSLLLLPHSFQTDWMVDLIVPALNYCQTGLLVKDPFYWQGLLSFPALRGDHTAGANRLSSENTSCYFEISTELLADPKADLDQYVNHKLNQTECILNTTTGSNYAGPLVRVGPGYGLRIEHIIN